MFYVGLCGGEAVRDDDTDWDRIFPVAKTVTCMFCNTSVRLLRRGRLQPLSGRPDFFYQESGWVEGRQSHACHRTVFLGKIGPEVRVTVPPVYGPHLVDFQEGNPYEGPRRKKGNIGPFLAKSVPEEPGWMGSLFD